jgi:hypothetical protein
MIAGSSSSLSDDGLYSEYGVQDDYPCATSSSRGQVGAAQGHVVIQEQDAAQQEARRRREARERKKR